MTSPNTTYNLWGLDLSATLQGAGGVGGLLAVYSPLPLGEGEGGLALPCYDANGNITEYLSTNGTIAAHYEYSPFGEIVVQSGDLASTFTHRFSTKPWCPVAGLSEYLFRKYSPPMGRWLNRDPLGDHASPGARMRHGEIIARLAFAALVNLDISRNDHLDYDIRSIAVLNALCLWHPFSWCLCIDKRRTGIPWIEER